ncbi:glycine--tRNA ligase subunit beta [Beggiatoa leptomitoformis]|uniref:Glycine--tRNA ligase beta subunit n=1 Tax=Beggiatoa leptomitoformis TaxID=288004 RepID=A0A2N9YHP9_9GAMM|nr:glycine--tRNA ligase subunit beta [Beggiatoa leptomitoformis]ALG67733.1 glycine--tRNA ligase subunit beta [Beggiatoa leptomitoformis]AUI70027.1 glycine--tRNA ligase subunit beta [Beggiatoa leptomitoformis]
MSATQDLLIEIGTEELPPKSLKNLSEAFLSGICEGLETQHIQYNMANPYATPRRLAVLVKGVAVQQPDIPIEKRGPALTAAYDKEGKPSKAAEGFARSCGVSFADLEKLETDKGAWLVYRTLQKGQATTELLNNIIHNALNALPIAKRMRWGNSDFAFVRPIHWVLILLGSQVIETEILGVKSGNTSRGHRFHHPDAITIHHADEYAKKLESDGFVIPTFSIRQQRVKILVEEAAEGLGGTAVIDPALLDEVTSIVENPFPITGEFEKEFLAVPPEALIATIKGNQKYFHVIDAQGQLLPYFITLANIQSKNPNVIKEGNERVIRPRLSDAMFFWNQDKLSPLADRQERLKTVTFQDKLGSLFDKSQRVAIVAGIIAKQLGADPKHAQRAAQLSKCDLMTSMVNEFPELQGIMGDYYARHDNEADAVAIALREQYMPRFWGDNLPQTPIGQALAIADKLDTLVGIFGIGQSPTGDKDPFGLRRATLGILRIVIECALPLNIRVLLQETVKAYPTELTANTTSEQVFEFMLDRLRGYYQEQGINNNSIEAVLSCQPESPLDADRRIRAVEAFQQLPAAESLAAANKRIHNILKKVEEPLPSHPVFTHFTEEAERVLYNQLTHTAEIIKPLLVQGDYQSSLQQLANLRDVVDSFFDKVMVMIDDEKVRRNRLALLQTLRALFLQIADISRLQG